MQDKIIVKKSESLFKESQNIGARIGSLGVIIQNDRELTIKETHDFFDRCNICMQEFNDWSTKTANYIDACNAKDLEDVNKDNLKKAKKAYKLN